MCYLLIKGQVLSVDGVGVANKIHGGSQRSSFGKCANRIYSISLTNWLELARILNNILKKKINL